MLKFVPLAALSFSLTACQTESSSGPTPAFDGVAEQEIIFLTGTEPFWGGEVSDGEVIYRTPENQQGTAIPVERFAGNNGLSFSGRIDGASFDLVVTPGSCSDGMSDATYPFTATLKIGEDQRSGCGWTDSKPRSSPEGG